MLTSNVDFFVGRTQLPFGDLFLTGEGVPNISERLIVRRSALFVSSNVPHHVVEHSPDGFEFGALSQVDFDVTIRAEQFEPLRAILDFPDIGSAGSFECRWFDPSIDVMKVKSGFAPIVSTPFTFISESFLCGLAPVTYLVPPVGLSALTALGRPSFVVIVSKEPFALDTKSLSSQVNASAIVLPFDRKYLSAFQTMSSVQTLTTEEAYSILAVRNLLATTLTEYFGEFSHVLLGIIPHDSPLFLRYNKDSACADFALNILQSVLLSMDYHGETRRCYGGECFMLAYRLHQQFKREFVATWTGQIAISIPTSLIVSWIKKHSKEKL